MEAKMHKTINIVIVDDEEDVRDTLKDYLGNRGFNAIAVEDAAGMRHLVEIGQAIDLAIIDVTMPGEDGLSLTRYLYEKTEIAIILVTASCDTTDRIVGLEMGADEYLSKPVDPRELLARIKAIIRRRPKTAEPKPAKVNEASDHMIVTFGNCRLDLDAHKLVDGDGQEIQLKAMEFELLETFANHPNRALNRDQLLMLAHNRSWEPFDRSVDIRIARIRRKIETDPGRPKVIKTVRGVGYMFCTESCYV